MRSIAWNFMPKFMREIGVAKISEELESVWLFSSEIVETLT